MEWKTIDSAPKDGSEILVLISHGGFYDYQIMKWAYGDWKMFCGHGNKSSLGVPTFWQELPSLPPLDIEE